MATYSAMSKKSRCAVIDLMEGFEENVFNASSV